MSRLSILGLYKWDEHLFDSMPLPEGIVSGRLQDTILLKCADLELCYPDYDLMKEAITLWCLKNMNNWNILNKALNKDYDPIGKSEVYEGSNTEQARDRGTGSSNGESKHSVAGFNSSTLAQSTKDETNLESGTTNEREAQVMRKYARTLYGSLGMHTSQELMEAEIRLRTEYNIYDVIAEDFKQEFCLLIY